MTDKVRGALEACRAFIEGIRKPAAYGTLTISSYHPCGALIDKIDAALTAEQVGRSEEREWQPIETAPRDEEFDGYGYLINDDGIINRQEFKRYPNCYWGERDSHYVRRKHGIKGWCVSGDDGWSWGVELTHWMPLPQPPKEN